MYTMYRTTSLHKLHSHKFECGMMNATSKMNESATSEHEAASSKS